MQREEKEKKKMKQQKQKYKVHLKKTLVSDTLGLLFPEQNRTKVLK